MELNGIEEVEPMTEEQWNRVLAWHHKRTGRLVEPISPELQAVSMRRLMYGEWLPDECEECHTRENVIKFADMTGKTKQPISLCRKCAGPNPTHLREWAQEEH